MNHTWKAIFARRGMASAVIVIDMTLLQERYIEGECFLFS